MPYVPKQKTDKEELDNGVALTDAGVGSTPVPSSQQQGAPAAGAQAPDSSKNCFNPQRYLQPNQGATQALGARVAGTVNTANQAATSALDAAKTGVTGLVNNATVNLDQNLINSALADPTGADVSQLAPQLSGSYAGPNSARDTGLLDAADSAVYKANQTAGLAGTTGGRKELIQQTTKAPTTAGALSLDQYLLQNTAGARDPLNQAVAQAKPLSEQATTQEQALNDAIATAKQTNKDTAEQAKGQFAGAADKLKADVDAEVKRKQDEEAMWQLNAKTYLQGSQTSDKLPPGLLDKLGMSASQWDQLVQQNLSLGTGRQDLSNYLSLQRPEDVVKPFNVATADQAARYQALSQLAGAQGGYLSPSNLQTAAPLTTFNAEGAQAQLNNVAANQQALAQQQAAADQQADAANRAVSQQRKQANTQNAIAAAGTIATIAIAVFCYAEGTRIMMADGSYVNVEDLELGDETYLGGQVIAYGVALAPEVYYYKGHVVTGLHPVFEDGVWLKVQDSKLSKLLETAEPVPVYPVGTVNHLLVTDSLVVSADVYELDDYDRYTSDERIAILNNMTERNRCLLTSLEGLSAEFYLRGALETNPVPRGGH